MGIEDELKKKLAEAEAKALALEDEAKGFIKKHRYYFIGGAFILGVVAGLIAG